MKAEEKMSRDEQEKAEIKLKSQLIDLETKTEIVKRRVVKSLILSGCIFPILAYIMEYFCSKYLYKDFFLILLALAAVPFFIALCAYIFFENRKENMQRKRIEYERKCIR